jgi:hypothetical protein
MAMLERLKRFEASKMSTDEMIELSMYARSILSEYAANDIEVPDFVTDALSLLGREIRAKEEDRLAKELKDLKATAQDDLTAAERREQRAEKIAKLERRLGVKPQLVGSAPAVGPSS